MFRRLPFCFCLGMLLTLHVVESAVNGQATEGLLWPQGQSLPHFPERALSVDVLTVQLLTPDEQLAFVALQGQVNKTQPRIWLSHKPNVHQHDKWFRTLKLNVNKEYSADNKYDLFRKYVNEVRGVVLYDTSHTSHMRNLASTIAGLRRALPVTPQIYKKLVELDIKLPVLEDLRKLELTSALEVYQYLYEEYWPDCEKRFILSARPDGPNGDYHHTRDLAAACGAATVWLDCRIPEERELFGKFMAEMPLGNAVVLGWYTTERSGVTAASEFGIGTMPADFFRNATVFAAGDHTIRIPNPPATPELKNKLYSTLIISDGDNIQYNQNAMRNIWDRSANVRGKMPLSWTIAPGLVDIAPDILNYYYSTASSNDCFLSGPSGLGYLIPVNTLKEPGAPFGIVLQDKSRMEAYVQFTSAHFKRAGMRMLTIWDNASPMHRAAYASYCPELIGVTVQNFKDDPTVASSVENNRLRFERLEIPYVSSARHLRSSLEQWAHRWDGKNPLFVAYQADIWNELKPHRLVALMQEMQKEYPQIEFVRADHFFLLQSEAYNH